MTEAPESSPDGEPESSVFEADGTNSPDESVSPEESRMLFSFRWVCGAGGMLVHTFLAVSLVRIPRIVIYLWLIQVGLIAGA